MDDRELQDRIRQGDHSAFDALFRATYAQLVGVTRSIVRDADVAEEIVQDVLLELWRRREALVVEDSLRAYLFRATRNRALNHLRHIAVERRGEPFVRGESAVSPRADARLSASEIEVAIRDAVAKLPERCREVFELSRLHGLKYSEIAQTLGISIKTVEAQMGKALRILREQLAPWLPEQHTLPERN
jgi:RNA polymerase sigma-70 factor (ECF subfamily)